MGLASAPSLHHVADWGGASNLLGQPPESFVDKFNPVGHALSPAGPYKTPYLQKDRALGEASRLV